VSALGLCLLLVGGHEAASLRVRLAPASLLIGARQVVSAPDGRFFVASNLARVHAYSAEAEPLGSFQVPTTRFRLHVAGPDLLLVVPDEGPPLAFDFEGLPADDPTGEELAATADDPTGEELAATADAAASAGALRVENGDVLSAASGRERVRVRGFASYGTLWARVFLTGLCLFSGGLLLIGGVVSTGRRVPS